MCTQTIAMGSLQDAQSLLKYLLTLVDKDTVNYADIDDTYRRVRVQAPNPEETDRVPMYVEPTGHKWNLVIPERCLPNVREYAELVPGKVLLLLSARLPCCAAPFQHDRRAHPCRTTCCGHAQHCMLSGPGDNGIPPTEAQHAHTPLAKTTSLPPLHAPPAPAASTRLPCLPRVSCACSVSARVCAQGAAKEQKRSNQCSQVVSHLSTNGT